MKFIEDEIANIKVSYERLYQKLESFDVSKSQHTENKEMNSKVMSKINNDYITKRLDVLIHME